MDLPDAFKESVRRESTYRGKRLSPEVGCSSCSIGEHCDEMLQWRVRSIACGVNGAIPCIRLHTAYAPKLLVEETV